MMKKNYLLGIAFVICNIIYSQSVFINEIHYDNSGGDVNEGVEIAGPFSTDLSGFSIVLYNGGNSSVYSTTTLSGTIPNNENYRGVIWFAISGIQNGSPDGIALVNPEGIVIQFLSYDGVITAVNGPAIGMTSTDIGVTETDTTPIGDSLQLIGSGTEYTDFSWSGSPITATDGSKNTGQTFTSESFMVVNGSVSGLNYEFGLGPSNEGNFSVSGYNLTDDIIVNAPANFEISLTSSGIFGANLTLNESLGIVGSTPIYIRLKASLPLANYNENLTLSSPGIITQNFAVSGSVFQKESLVITGIIDGPLPSGTPKAIELYVINEIPDLSIYGIGVANNGGGTDGQEFTFPNISLVKDTYIYLTNNATNFTSFFGFSPNYNSIIFSVDGNDSVELFENGVVIDVFGDVNVDGTGQPWEYTDGWAYRNTAGPNSTFSESEWDYSGINALDGETTNATATTPFPIGTYDATVLSVVKNNIGGFAMYPNPVTNGKLFMTSTNNQVKKNVEIYSLNGQQVYKKEIYPNEVINISHVPKGFYLVKIIEEGKIATRKLIVL